MAIGAIDCTTVAPNMAGYLLKKESNLPMYTADALHNFVPRNCRIARPFTYIGHDSIVSALHPCYFLAMQAP